MTSLLVGLAIADGKLTGIDTRIGKILPEWKEGRRGKVTIAHLLTMTSGLLRMRSNGVPSAGAEICPVKLQFRSRSTSSG